MGSGPNTVVLGMGNLILSDDGVGVHALRALEMDPRLPPAVRLVDGGTFGTELVGFVAGAWRLVILDAVDVAAEPGTLIRVTGDELRDLPGAGGVHGLGAAELLSALRLLDEEPGEILLLGVQPGSTAPGTGLSPAVAAALPRLVEAALAAMSPAAPPASFPGGSSPAPGLGRS